MSRRRALVIAPRLPEFDRESGLRRLSDLIEMLIDRDWEVTFGCKRVADGARYVRGLEQLGVETHAPLESIDALRRNGEGFDLAIIAFWHIAERYLPELRRCFPATRVIVDSVDLHFLREMRDQLRDGDSSAPRQLAQAHAQQLMRELNTYAAADAVLTVSEKEAALINDLTGRDELAIAVPDTEELPRSAVPLRRRRGILFLGNFLHAPNRDAAEYLCGEIIPRLDRSLLAEHEISIVGTAAEEHVQKLALDLPHVKTVGWVPSVVPYLENARLSIVPLKFGAGTKRKVIQALMAGTPTVTTTVGAEGLRIADGRHALIADDPEAFAAGVERLLRRSITWRRLARRGREHVLRLHGRAAVEARFDQALGLILGRKPLTTVSETSRADAAISKYERLVARVGRMIESELPAGSTALIATRGDDGFLDLSGRRGWHFPRQADGAYAGYYPADSDAAIAHLEQLRSEGAAYLVLPQTAFWWLDHYPDFGSHLARRYERVHEDDEALVYDLAGIRPRPASVPERVDGSSRNGGEPKRRTEAPEPNGKQGAVTADLIEKLRPTAVGAASNYLNGRKPRRALVLGVYLANKPNTIEHITEEFGRPGEVEVRQRWVALGAEPPTEAVAGATAETVIERAPKYALLNRLLRDEDLASYDYVLTVDDDIVLPHRFLELFLGVQAQLGFDIAQPARTLNSYVDHPIVLQQRGVVARRTLFVEIGPMVSFGREIYDLVFPFDERNEMGWGFENAWSRCLRDRNRAQGIVDAVPVDHSIRAPVAHYDWSEANGERDEYLARTPHLPYEECFKILDVFGARQ